MKITHVSNTLKGIAYILFSILLILSIYFYLYPIKLFLDDSNILTLYDEITQQIEKKGIFFTSPVKKTILKQKGIKQFLLENDHYSNYLSSEENSMFQESLKPNYVGVGMEIMKNKIGSISCFPYENQPAHIAGIQSGDILIEVNDIGVSNKSIFKIASMIKGKPGEKVKLTIKRKNNQIKKYLVKRTQVQTQSVFLKWYDKHPLIKIKSFMTSTQLEIKSLLRSILRPDFIVIDLRNNPGGDLFSAIDSAMLFLPENSPIVDIVYKNHKKQYTSTTPGMHNQSKIYLIQNQNSASAAEIFIAALTQNKRAESFGSTTFGKGTQQSLISLSDNSLMIITTAYLLPPNQTSFNEKGLNPTYKISDELNSINTFISNLTGLKN